MKNINGYSNCCKPLRKQIYYLLAFVVLTAACKKTKDDTEGNLHSSKRVESSNQAKNNVLTEREKKEGWNLLYDGKTPNGWRGIYLETFPDKGWDAENGALTNLGSSDESKRGGAIITEDQYSNFELSLEFRIMKGANSGIKYFVLERLPETPGHGLGFEYAILDDVNFIYPERGDLRTMASLYDLIPAKNKNTKPLNEWNQARIIVQGNHVEHWLNGSKVVEFEQDSEVLKALISKSKYKDIENFGKGPKGHILLQDEGTPTSFRNIKIRELK